MELLRQQRQALQERWSQSRRLPLLQVVSNNKSFSVGVESPTEINAPRGRTLSGRQWFCADRGGLYVLRDLEQDSVNPVLSPSGLISCKKGYPIGYPFAWKERETGLEPAASTLARSRSTNWATRAFLIVLCSCWTQDIIYRITLFLSIIFTQKNKVRNYTVFSENSFNYLLRVYDRINRPETFRFKHPAPERFFITIKFLLLSFLHIRQKNSRMPRHSCCEVRVMQLHDILLLRTSASLHSVSVGAKPLFVRHRNLKLRFLCPILRSSPNNPAQI